MQRQQSKISLINKIDKPVVLIYLALVFMGWFNIYAAVYSEEHSSIFDFGMQYGKQMIWIVAAFILVMMTMLIDSKFYPMFSWPIYVSVLLLLVAVIFFGREVNGARSWFEIGSLRLQPAEFAKLSACLVLSKELSSHNINLQNFRTLLRIGAILLVPAALILAQNDTGSALVYSAFAFVLYRQGMSGTYMLLAVLAAMLFIVSLMYNPVYVVLGVIVIAFFVVLFDRRNIIETGIGAVIYTGVYFGSYFFVQNYYPLLESHFVLIVAFLICSVSFLIYAYMKKAATIYYVLLLTVGALVFMSSVDYIFDNVLEKHQRTRINVLLGLESDPQGAEYNVNQSKIAIGSGGFTGKGFLQGTQTKFNFVPEQSTDFIFCTVGEEWGFLGTFTVIGLFVALLLRLIFLAERQRSLYSKLLGYCVVSILFFHIAINVGMTIGILPVIGIPLPFFSYGGSSLWTFSILLFIFVKLDTDRTSLIQ